MVMNTAAFLRAQDPHTITVRQEPGGNSANHAGGLCPAAGLGIDVEKFLPESGADACAAGLGTELLHAVR